MVVKDGFADESIAYALAAGFVVIEDRDGEKARRRMRRERNAKRHAK